MKLLTLIRHAKSDWDNDLSDFDRPLNTKGLNDAPATGKYINSNLPKPDLIISSYAVRADETAKLIAKEINYDTSKIKYYDELYHCSITEYFEILIRQHFKTNHIIIVSHNPGTTGFVTLLTDKNIDTIPTCGVAHIELDILKWEDVEPGMGKLIKLITPEEFNNI